jgi:hypothetical protein
MRNYATHIALLVQLDDKQRMHGKVTEWTAVTLLIKIASEFAILYTTMYVSMGRKLFKIFKYFS